jgi:streptomycin 6-kinase
VLALTQHRLATFASSADGQAWLEALPQLLHECVRQWSLQVGEPFADGSASLTLAVELGGGRDAVLKIQFPHHATGC